MDNKLQEETQLTARDIELKIQKLDGYIRKAKQRIAAHERKLEILQKKNQIEVKLKPEGLRI